MKASSDLARCCELDRLKSEFVSVVSHELRTPLTAIKGCLDGVRRGYSGNPETLLRMLDMARQNADRLGRMIDDLLDLARIERHDLALRSVAVPVGAVLREVAASKDAMSRERGVSLVVRESATSPKIKGDEDRLFQAIANLVDNAIKFSPPGGEVCLEVVTDAGLCGIRVTDVGPGIAPASHEEIFQKFHQLDSTAARKSGGIGLGLFIARQVVEAMDGRLGVDSAPGRGSTFEISLPLAGDPIEAIPGMIDILLIDDDPAFTRFLALVLGRESFRVQVARDPADGIALARMSPPDLILVDLMMPEMDGWEVIERLQEDPGTREIPIAILSALRPDEGAHRFRSYRYIEKDGHPGRLLRAIREFAASAGLVSCLPGTTGVPGREG